jgi:hypothetical protein
MASNQHYVPRFLLRNFCAGARPRIWAYDKSTGKSFETTVDNVAAERNFYETKIGDSILSLEERLSKLESKASVIIDRIVQDRSIGGLSGDDRIEIAAFVATQMLRGPHAREHVKALGDAVRGTLAKRGVDQESIERLLPDLSPDQAKGLALASLRSAEEFAPHIVNKSWLLFKTDPATPLYISDNPVGLQNLVEKATPLTGNLGLAVLGIEIYLPIASTLSLGFYCRSHEQVIREGVERCRINTIHSPDLPIPHFGELLKWTRAFRTGVALDLELDNVVNQNSLQVRQAERYVYSNVPDFALVENMIAKQSMYRKGPRPRVV